MFVSIVIPLYNTPLESFEQCLESIDKQSFKDIEVIIVDDNSNIDYSELIEKWKEKLNINYFYNEVNSGPGTSRRIGMEMCKGTHVMFVDSDDELLDFTSVQKLVNIYDRYEKENKQLDMVAGLAFEVLKNGEKKLHSKNFIWVFGKLFDLEFLRKNNITFNDTRANEDNGFTTLFRMLSDNYVFIDSPVYLWKYSPQSITRRNDHEYYFYSIEGYIENMTWVYTECKKRDVLNKTKCLEHFVNVWIRLYFYTVEVAYDRKHDDLDLLDTWCRRYYQDVYSELLNEKRITVSTFNKCYLNSIRFTIDTFTKRICYVSYIDFERCMKNGIKLSSVFDNKDKGYF